MQILYFLVALGAISGYYAFSRTNLHPLPPGPKPRWIVGNFRDMPKSSEWLTFTEWRKKYGEFFYLHSTTSAVLIHAGEIVFVRIFRTPIVILNSYRTAFQLLDKRSKIYSGRPFFPMAVDLVGFDWGITLLQSTHWHRYTRRMFEGQFRPSLVHNYYDNMKRNCVLLLRNLLETPEDFAHHLR